MQRVLPNAITVLRFPLAIAFALVDGLAARITIVALAAASDWADGRLARATGHVSHAGEVLDPIADKTFMLVVLVTLALDGTIPFWTLPLLLARDIGVAMGAGLLFARGTRVRRPARRAGKAVTWLQFAGIALLLLWPESAYWLAWAVGIAGILALIDYGRAVWAQHARKEASGKEEVRDNWGLGGIHLTDVTLSWSYGAHSGRHALSCVHRRFPRLVLDGR